MQLDLFEDNRPAILLNIADEFILARDLDQAVSVYQQLLIDYPADRQTTALMKLVSEWSNHVALLNGRSVNPSDLQEIWLRLADISHPGLLSTVLAMLVDALAALPEPALIYTPPRFHLGQVLMEAGRYTEAADVFQTALSGNEIPRGRFLAWRGDALTLAGKEDAAMKCYLNAFLDDPLSVDSRSIRNQRITNLHASLHCESTDEIEEEQELAWLPAWGWIQGVFPLAPRPAPGMEPARAAEFEARLGENDCNLSRLWYEMLTHAERLRVMRRDDSELAATRRLMKRTNGYMFGWYLGKIREGS